MGGRVLQIKKNFLFIYLDVHVQHLCGFPSGPRKL